MSVPLIDLPMRYSSHETPHKTVYGTCAVTTGEKRQLRMFGRLTTGQRSKIHITWNVGQESRAFVPVSGIAPRFQGVLAGETVSFAGWLPQTSWIIRREFTVTQFDKKWDSSFAIALHIFNGTWISDSLRCTTSCRIIFRDLHKTG